MSFNFNGKNTHTNKSAFRTLIARKQQFFKRLARRINQSHDAAERSFLKAEARRVVGELKNFAAQWKKNGFGTNGWVTRGYNVSGYATRTTSRRTSRSTTRGYKSRSSARRGTRSSYRSYVAW